MRILVVEEPHTSSGELHQALERDGYGVDSAGNGVTALDTQRGKTRARRWYAVEISASVHALGDGT